MKKTFNLRIFSISLSISFLLLAGLTVWATKSNRQSVPIEVANKTQSVQITSFSENLRTTSTRDVALSFQNNNPLGIVAYSVEVVNQPLKQSYFIASSPFEGGRALPSAHVFTEEYAIPDRYNLITLEAVVFEDGTIEGDSLHANYLKGRWMGTKEQYRSALDVIRQAESDHSADAFQLNESLKNGLAQLPEEPKEAPDKKSSHEAHQYFMGRSMGMTQAKNTLLAEVDGTTEKLTVEKVNKGIGDPETRLKRLREERSRIEAVVRMEAVAQKP